MKKRMTKEEEAIVCLEYLNGKSTCTIGKERGYSDVTIWRKLNNNGITTHKTFKGYGVSREVDFFEKIDSERKAYFLGLLVADGCIYKKELIISLQEEDGYILNELSKDFKLSEERVVFLKKVNNNRKNQSCLRIYNTKLSEDLAKYGVVPKKSHTSFFPDIPENLYPHFIRGLFDGDGSISKPKKGFCYTFNICGNYSLITVVQRILAQECNLKLTKLSIPKKSCPNINVVIYSGNRQCLKIKDYLYKDATIFLQRKKEKFDEIIVQWGTKGNLRKDDKRLIKRKTI